jgi:diguanylate cyclase (GGDEF)-like protein/PAS domain S-box-containing protein
MAETPQQFGAHLKHKLAMRVTLGVFLFALIAGAVNAWFVFNQQHSEARTMQDQLAATVRSSAAVAAFVKNEEIARDVVSGLLSHPMVVAARITADNGNTVFSSSRAHSEEVADGSTVRYPLSSPVNADEVIGQLEIGLDVGYINTLALKVSIRQLVVLALQIGISALLLIVLFDYVVARPLKIVARRVEAVTPGSSERLEFPRGHADDEIGSLVHRSNHLLETVERTLKEERDLRAKVEAMEEHYRRIFETTNVGIMVLDQNGRLINSNPALLSRIVGIRLDGMLEAESFQFIDTIFVDPAVVWGLISKASSSSRSTSEDCQLRTADGSVRWVHCIISVVVGQKDQIELIEGVLYDVTDRKAAEDRARRQADHDALTGLRNRRGMEFFLDRSLRHAAEDADELGVMLIDLDGFKAINDTYGHDAGDQVLIGVANRMLARVRRASDLVARLGGDEFVVVATHSGPEAQALQELAADLVRVLREPFSIPGGAFVQIGASIGVARYPHNGLTRFELMAAADAAMYEAKRSGKNRFAMAQTGVDSNEAEVV